MYLTTVAFDQPTRLLPVRGPLRPRWSVMVPTYDCAGYLGRTLASVLAQAPPPDDMQIEVVDDCSGDDPEAVVRTVGAGRVGFWRQPRNVGISANFTACLARARGLYVHVLHGDDVVYPGLYRAAAAVLDSDESIDAVIAGGQDIGPDDSVVVPNRPLRPTAGILDDFEPDLFGWNPVRAPAVLARRRMYERLGGFHPQLRYCTDWDMWKRMIVYAKVAHLPDVLVGYRVHPGSDTARLGRSPAQLRDMIRSVRIAYRYPARTSPRRHSNHFYWTVGCWAGEGAARAWSEGDRARALEYGAIAAECRARRLYDRLAAR